MIFETELNGRQLRVTYTFIPGRSGTRLRIDGGQTWAAHYTSDSAHYIPHEGEKIACLSREEHHIVNKRCVEHHKAMEHRGIEDAEGQDNDRGMRALGNIRTMIGGLKAAAGM